MAVTGRRLFYNHSAFDAGGAGDLAAVARDKEALLPGQGPGGFANVSSYDRGINGLLLQFFSTGARPDLTAEDLEFRVGRAGDPAGWPLAPATPTVNVIPVPGPNSVYAVTFPDGAIRNTWLRVKVNATARTGLAAPDVFYFGNLVGETGDAGSPLRVGALDLANVKRALNTTATPADPPDVNRDGRVNALDLGAVRVSLFQSLQPVTPPPAITASFGAVAKRRVWNDVESPAL